MIYLTIYKMVFNRIFVVGRAINKAENMASFFFRKYRNLSEN